MNNKLRFPLITALTALSVGFIAYSCLSVSYPVGTDRLNELAVTELSLTHSIERESDGKLTYPGEMEEEPVETPEVEPAPVEPDVEQPVVEQAPAQEPTDQQPAAKKPAKKKKAPPKKKPAPKKEPPKKGDQACPT